MWIAVFSCTLTVVMAFEPIFIPLDQKLKMIFGDIDETNDEHIVPDEVYIFFHEFKEDPSDDHVDCSHSQHVWHHKYLDHPDIAYRMCTEYFDSNGDARLDIADMDVLFPKIDINPANGQVDYNEFDVYFRKMYHDLGITER